MWTRLLQLPERFPGRTLLALTLASLVAYSASLTLLRKPDGRIVIGDAVHYYVFLRSAVFDHDLHFRNDFVNLYGLEGGEPNTEWIYQDTATGHVQNVMSVGPAMAWAPLYLLVCALAFVARALGSTYPLDGFGRIYQAAAGYSGLLAGGLGVWLSYRLCAQFFSARAAIWSAIALWLGSNAVYYTGMSPTYSHAISLMVMSGFFYVWARTLDRQTIGRYLVVGVLAGCCALTRFQDAIVLIVPALDAASRAWPAGTAAAWRRATLLAAAAGAGAIAAFSPQMYVWAVLYGDPLLVPQGSSFMRFSEPHVLDTLFSFWRGLFTWTPVFLPAVAGLALLRRRDRLVGDAAIVTFTIAVYVNASIWDWWAGEAYGARRFLSCFPLFALGLAALFDRVQPRLTLIAGTSAACILLNGLLLLQYQAFMHGFGDTPYPHGAYGLFAARFLTPMDLARWWWAR